MSTEYEPEYYLDSTNIAVLVCLAIITAALTVASLFFMVECFLPEFIEYWKEERKAKKMIKPIPSKELIAQLTAQRDKKQEKNQKKRKLQDSNI